MMRQKRNAFKGALYHAMNRGHSGSDIFAKEEMKIVFCDLLMKYKVRYRINVITYCIMTNHYHLIIENSSGLMSEFFRVLNGSFGNIYRKKEGGKGAVFQDRYKSLLIKDDAYLYLSIAYTLNNPVRKSMCTKFSEYKWSSGTEYFSSKQIRITNPGYLEELFGDIEHFSSFVHGMENLSQDNVYIAGACERREEEKTSYNEIERKVNRIKSDNFLKKEEVVDNFELLNGVDLSKVNFSTNYGKNLRAALLIELKDHTGLKYSEIGKLSFFL